jgi:hypothetical protein
MPGDPGQFALDGRANGPVTLPNNTVVQDGQILPWRPVEHYRSVHDSRDRKVARNRGTLGAAGQGGPPAGTSWDTPSTLDASTVLAEILTVKYVDADGSDWTVTDMVIELFKDLQARRTGGK